MGVLIAKYSGVFFLAMIKFVFAPAAGWAAGLTFTEVYSVGLAGGLLSFSIFYLSANHFMKKARLKRLDSTVAAKKKKAFTKFNKFMVRMKMSPVGFWLVIVLAPNFASVPLGSIIVAKFYGHLKSTYWIGLAVLSGSAFIWTMLWKFIE
jgi:hypothetical protein